MRSNLTAELRGTARTMRRKRAIDKPDIRGGNDRDGGDGRKRVMVG